MFEQVLILELFSDLCHYRLRALKDFLIFESYYLYLGKPTTHFNDPVRLVNTPHNHSAKNFCVCLLLRTHLASWFLI